MLNFYIGLFVAILFPKMIPSTKLIGKKFQRRFYAEAINVVFPRQKREAD